MTNALRIGVIGLGSRWRKRYQPALRALHKRFAVKAVCDAVRERAAAEASHLHCHAAGGPTALLERDDVDAVLLSDWQWFGLWPVELACRFAKPVFCGCPLESDDAHADRVVRKAEESRLPVMVAMAPRFAAETALLREILEAQLGPARRVLCDAIRPCRAGHPDAAKPAVALLDWCASLLGGEAVRIMLTGMEQGSQLLLDFGGGRQAEVIHRRWPGVRRLRLEVLAERGRVAAELPGRVYWTATDGRHIHLMNRRQPIGRLLLERFHRTVTAGDMAGPTLRDAHRVLGWLRAAARSREVGGWVDVTG